MPSFTPGNWTVQNRMTCGEGWAVASDHEFSGKTKPYRVYVTQIAATESDAHLLSAAKELYAALDELVSAWERGAVEDGHASIGLAKAALAKARGVEGTDKH